MFGYAPFATSPIAATEDEALRIEGLCLDVGIDEVFDLEIGAELGFSLAIGVEAVFDLVIGAELKC